MPPYRRPGCVGVNVKSTVQVCPARYAVPVTHEPPVTKLKSRFGAPRVSTLIAFNVPPVTNVTVAVCTALAVPTCSVSVGTCARTPAPAQKSATQTTAVRQWSGIEGPWSLRISLPQHTPRRNYNIVTLD